MGGAGDGLDGKFGADVGGYDVGGYESCFMVWKVVRKAKVTVSVT